MQSALWQLLLTTESQIQIVDAMRVISASFLSIVLVCLTLCHGFRVRAVTRDLNVQTVHKLKSPPVTVSALHLLPSSSYPFVEEAVLVHGILSGLLVLAKQKSLTTAGLIHSTILGVGLWTFLDFQGWLVCASYLVLGSLATKVRMQEKEKLGIAEKRGGARGPENVWGSAATAMVCALGTYLFPQYASLCRIGYVAAIASKLSDTFGSELGKAFGKNTYLITSLKMVPKGTEGAVSVEGTLWGVVGSILIAVLSSAVGVIPPGFAPVVVCILAAFVATTAESYIGAVLQNDKRPWLSNELVNFVMTLIGAVTAMSFAAVANVGV